MEQEDDELAVGVHLLLRVLFGVCSWDGPWRYLRVVGNAVCIAMCVMLCVCILCAVLECFATSMHAQLAAIRRDQASVMEKKHGRVQRTTQ